MAGEQQGNKTRRQKEEEEKKKKMKRKIKLTAIKILTPIILIIFLASALYAIFDWIIGTILEKITEIFKAMVDFFKDVGGFFKNLWESIGNFFKELFRRRRRI